jgi:hypothetical protein
MGSQVTTHPNQKRTELIYDPILHFVARYRAIELAQGNYFDHVNPEGFGPNRIVQLAGFKLPDWYGEDRDANYLESLARGYDSSTQAVQAWINSESHRQHILAEDVDNFYMTHTRYGAGYARTTFAPFTKIYVFITAPPNELGELPIDPYIEWSFQHFSLTQLDTYDDEADYLGDGVGRLLRFVTEREPWTFDPMPRPSQITIPTSGTDLIRLEWNFKLRENTGPFISATVEQSTQLGSWTTQGVGKDGTGFYLESEENSGFLRFRLERSLIPTFGLESENQ